MRCAHSRLARLAAGAGRGVALNSIASRATLTVRSTAKRSAARRLCRRRRPVVSAAGAALPRVAKVRH